MNIYKTCKTMIVKGYYYDKNDYQKRLDIFLAIQGLTLVEYTELTEMLNKANKE